MSGYVEFEFDLPGALLTQVVHQFARMKDEQLTLSNISQIAPNAQGVYQLFHESDLVYIGKSDAEAGLHTRLARHAQKIVDRIGLEPSKITFKAIRIAVFAAMDLETQLISHYGRPAWNSSGFGSNDPGRNREQTNKDPIGFDGLYPIDIDIPLAFIAPGTHQISDLLVLLKDNLPYTFRYEVAGRPTGQSYRTNPHADYLTTVIVPNQHMTMREVMRLILSALPHGWQATGFVSHVILYKETRAYAHGTLIV
jgi:hypothetical protein